MGLLKRLRLLSNPGALSASSAACRAPSDKASGAWEIRDQQSLAGPWSLPGHYFDPQLGWVLDLLQTRITDPALPLKKEAQQGDCDVGDNRDRAISMGVGSTEEASPPIHPQKTL